ncbi:unnamed protein product [Arabis nemorensis]|uniref:Uncharacterized protein n=1 Tax=Arabis nemorensis TaxID=586526 RepID=A0A565CFB9_9BRAS|nr:unnamed protein product [Arabis nemorensis]
MNELFAGLNLEAPWPPGNFQQGRETTRLAIVAMMERRNQIMNYIIGENNVQHLQRAINELNEMLVVTEPAVIAPPGN